MIMGRNHFSNGAPNLAEQCFRIAMQSGIPEASLWLAELLLTKFTPCRQEEARMLYQSVAQDMDDDRSASLASARLFDLFCNEDETIKEVICKSFGRWSAFTPDDPQYDQALLDYCWVMENFSRKRENWNFKIIDWLQKRKYIKGTPPGRGSFWLMHRHEDYQKEVEENNNQSVGHLNAEIKKLYKILAKRGFLKGIVGLHKFYLRIGDLKKAENCLRESSKKHDPHILLTFGRFYEAYGKNKEEAQRLYQLAANRKNAYAKIWIGSNTLAGTGDLTTCLCLHREAASSGNAYAAYILYTAYQNGFFLERKYVLPLNERSNSQEKTSYWFTISHILGNPWVMKTHLNTFRDMQDFDNGILYLQKHKNPLMKQSTYLNNIGYFYMKKYELSKDEEHFNEAKKSFENVEKVEPKQSFEGINAFLNLSWLYYIHSQYNPLTKANAMQRAYTNISDVLHYSYYTDCVSRQLSGLTEEESKSFQEMGRQNRKKIEETAKRLGIKLQSIGYD